LPSVHHKRVILHWPTKFRQNRSALGGVMMSYQFFSRWRPTAIFDLIWIILDHPQSAIVCLRLVLIFGLDRIYSFGDIVIFIFWHFGSKLPIHAYFLGFWRHIPPTDVTHHPNPQNHHHHQRISSWRKSYKNFRAKRHFLTRKHVVFNFGIVC